MSDLTVSANKLAQLNHIASGNVGAVDSANIKTKIAHFLLAHADKVMDTVAPLEELREALKDEYVERVRERLGDEELSPGMVARMIDDVQMMNRYSIEMLRGIMDADKLQTIIAVDASTNVGNIGTTNSLNLDTSISRTKVAKAVEALRRVMNEEIIEGEVDVIENTEGESN